MHACNDICYNMEGIESMVLLVRKKASPFLNYGGTLSLAWIKIGSYIFFFFSFWVFTYIDSPLPRSTFFHLNQRENERDTLFCD